MKKERSIIGGLLILQGVLWLGFLVHHSQRFPGSKLGVALGILAAVLLVLPPLFYSITKRVKAIRERVSRKISLSTLLSWHVYAGIIGSIVAIVHTGHHFESYLGILLTAMMLCTVLSGFIGRYFLSYSSQELQEKKDQLTLLATQYNQLIDTSYKKADVEKVLPARAFRLTESIADLEYAIQTHEFLKRRTAQWLSAHILTSCIFYFLLWMHIWSALYFGLTRIP